MVVGSRAFVVGQLAGVRVDPVGHAQQLAGIAQVVERMKAENRKSRVTFYYLLAEVTGTLSKLA